MLQINWTITHNILLLKDINYQISSLSGLLHTKALKFADLMLIKIQLDATVCRYLFTAKSLYMFRVSQHPSWGVLKTVTTASGIGHNIGTATSLQRGQVGREVAAPILWPVPEAGVTIFSTHDDGCCDTRNMYSDFAVNKYLHNVASIWIFINTELWCTEPCALKKKLQI